jgi:hypothetical protein
MARDALRRQTTTSLPPPPPPPPGPGSPTSIDQNGIKCARIHYINADLVSGGSFGICWRDDLSVVHDSSTGETRWIDSTGNTLGRSNGAMFWYSSL